MQSAGLDIEPPEVDVELGEASLEALAGEGLSLEMQAFEDAVALLCVGFGECGRDAALGEVETAAFDQERLTRLLLKIQPQLPGFEGQPRVNRVQIVVANRPRHAEGGRSWIADAPLV